MKWPSPNERKQNQTANPDRTGEPLERGAFATLSGVSRSRISLARRLLAAESKVPPVFDYRPVPLNQRLPNTPPLRRREIRLHLSAISADNADADRQRPGTQPNGLSLSAARTNAPEPDPLCQPHTSNRQFTLIELKDAERS